MVKVADLDYPVSESESNKKNIAFDSKSNYDVLHESGKLKCLFGVSGTKPSIFHTFPSAGAARQSLLLF
jgi:hypothetical protein